MINNYLDLAKFKESSIGTNVDSRDCDLEVKMEYSSLDWFFITFFGTTRIPQKVTFKCLKSGENFEVLTDKKLIKYYITYRRK